MKSFIYYSILLILITGFLSALYMVFFVFKFDSVGPLWDSAKDIPLDFFIKRRIYAIEAWLIFGILCLYLAITNKK